MPRQSRQPFIIPEEIPSENTIHPAQREDRGITVARPPDDNILQFQSITWEVDVNGTTVRIFANDQIRQLQHEIHVVIRGRDFFQAHATNIEIRQIARYTVAISFDGHVIDGSIMRTQRLDSTSVRPTQWETRNNTGTAMGVMTPHGIITQGRATVAAQEAAEIRTSLQELAIQNDVIGDVLEYDDSRRIHADYVITGLEPCSDISLSQTELNFIQQLELEYGEMKCACCAEHIHFPQNILKKLGQKETKAYLEFCKKNDQTPEIFCCKCYRIAESTPAFIQAYHHLFGQVKTFEKLVHDHVNQIATMKSQALEHERLNKEVELKKQMLEEMILELAAKHNLKNVNVDIK